MGAVEEKIWCKKVHGSGRPHIEEIRGGVKGLDPKGRRKVRLGEKAPDYVICGTDHALSLTVLR